MADDASAPRVSTEHKRQRWANLPVFAFAQFSDGQESGLNALFPAITKALGLDSGALGTLSGISKVVRIVFGTLWAIVGDKYGRKKVLVFVTGVWGLWIAAAGLAKTYSQLLILYALGAIGAVAAEPIQNGMLAGMFEDRERGRLARSVHGTAPPGRVRGCAGLRPGKPTLGDAGVQSEGLGRVWHTHDRPAAGVGLVHRQAGRRRVRENVEDRGLRPIEPRPRGDPCLRLALSSIPSKGKRSIRRPSNGQSVSIGGS